LAETVPTLRENASTTDQPDVLVVPLGFFAHTWWLLRRAFVAAYEDNCFSIAKGAAYSSLLSLFPVLTTMTAILFQLNAEPVVQVIARFARQIVPPGTEDLVLSRLHERGVKPIPLSAIAIGVSLWAGSGAMVTLMEGFQAAYRIPAGRPFLKQRAMAVFLVLIAAFPAVAASSLILFGNRIELAIVHWVGGSGKSAVTWLPSPPLLSLRGCSITSARTTGRNPNESARAQDHGSDVYGRALSFQRFSGCLQRPGLQRMLRMHTTTLFTAVSARSSCCSSGCI
jgi:hypothetical protein